MTQTVIVYTVRPAEACEFGWPSAQMLYKPEHLSWCWVTVAEYALPGGYSIGETASGTPAIFRGDEYINLASDSHNEPVILDLDGGYPSCVPLVKLCDLSPYDVDPASASAWTEEE